MGALPAEKRANAVEDDPVAAPRALALLCDEISTLRRLPEGLPRGVDSISDPTPAPYVVREDERQKCELSVNPEGKALGPWHVHVRIRGDEGSGYDESKGYVVRLTFAAAYPNAPPDVHVLSKCHHLLVDGDREVAGVFFHPENLPPTSVERTVDPATGDEVVKSVTYTLEGILDATRRFFSVPCRLPGPPDDDRVNNRQRHLLAEWRKTSDANRERERVIASYERGTGAAGRKRASLFDPTGVDEWLHPAVLAAAREGSEGRLTPGRARELCEEVAPGIFAFPLLNDAYCDALMDEAAHFQASGLPVARPNSMNNYGLILNEIGMEQAMDALQARVLSPVAEALFPAQGGGCLDGHHSFIVQYSEGADLGLDMHTDDSDVTFNVCLGKEFSGAGLQFCGVLGGPSHRKRSLVYHHAKGRCVVHLGAHRHGADDLESGERLNLIIWNHSSLYRSSRAYRWRDVPPETEPPDPQCLSYTHDVDYGRYKKYPEGKEGFAKTAWYPPEADQVKMK